MLLNCCLSYAACIDTPKASEDVCHIDRKRFGDALLAVTVYRGGSCLSGRRLSVIRRVNKVIILGDPRDDALVDTCEKTDYSSSSSWAQDPSGNTQANDIYQLHYCTWFFIPGQPSDLVRRLASTAPGSSRKSRSLFPPSRTPVQTQQTTQASILAHLAASPCTTGT